MKATVKMIGALVIASALATTQAQAQCGDHHHGAGWHGIGCQAPEAQSVGCQGVSCGSACGQYRGIYDPKTIEKCKGKVMRLEKFTPAKGVSWEVYLFLKTETESISVYLGPSWYLDHQEEQIEPMDQIEITGSRVTFDGKPVLIAAEVKKGSGVLKLRDENGLPMWAGWRRH